MASAMVCCHRLRSRPCLYTSSCPCSHYHPSCNPPCPCRSSGPGKRAYPIWPCPSAAKRPVSRLKLPLGSWRRTSRSLARRLRRRLLLLSLSLGPFCFVFCSPSQRHHAAGSRSNLHRILLRNPGFSDCIIQVRSRKKSRNFYSRPCLCRSSLSISSRAALNSLTARPIPRASSGSFSRRTGATR